MMETQDWILEGLSLDHETEIETYILGYRAFYVFGHPVVLAVCKNGDTSFTVDGCCDADNIPPRVGAAILRRLLSEWDGLAKEAKAQGIIPFCYPTETDGKVARRVKMFQRAGFRLADTDGKMIAQ